jgi:serine/threonine protein kinase
MKPRAFLERLARPFSSSRRSSSDQSRRDREEEADLEAIAAREQRAFRYETLAAATRSFSEKNRLGQGGFGPVYRGRLEDGRDVAVKRLGAGSRQGAREFRNEATLLSRVQHRNVVNLIGYCARGAEDKLLVYEYVPNESLDKILFSSSSSARCESSSFLPSFSIVPSLSLSLPRTPSISTGCFGPSIAQVRAIPVSCDLTTGLPLRWEGIRFAVCSIPPQHREKCN